jgi:hypothetical protein
MKPDLCDLYMTFAQHAANEIAQYLDHVLMEGAELDMDYLRALHNILRDQITDITTYQEKSHGS